MLWRISNHADLSGAGGEKTDGRWHSAERGKRIVYLSEHPALALIEVLANLTGNPRLLPDGYQLIKIRVSGEVTVDSVQEDALGQDWRDDLSMTRARGDDWLRNHKTTLLSVPSAPSPESRNYLLNPLHRAARNFSVEWSRWVEFDKRLFRIRETSTR